MDKGLKNASDSRKLEELSAFEVLSLIAKKTDLREGPEGVRQFLREIYRSPGLGTKKLAKIVGLPLPVTVAVRNELERAGICISKGGIQLSEEGVNFVVHKMGFREKTRFICPQCMGAGIIIPKDIAKLRSQLHPYFKLRGPPDTQIDQAYATPDTSIRRTVFMLEQDCIEGRNIILLGDSDLTALPIAYLDSAVDITVLDIDPRVGQIIDQFNREQSTRIKFVHHNLRSGIPKPLRGRYNVVVTDPPYTLLGIGLFLDRGLECLVSDTYGSIFLSFGNHPPEKTLKLQKMFNMKGLVTKQLLPGFNFYEGARIIGSRSTLFHLVSTHCRPDVIPQYYDGPLYTGEVRKTVRVYLCPCGTHIQVGATTDIATIEILKSQGCPKCGSNQGFQLQSRQSVNSG